LDQELLAAANSGNLAKVKSLLSAGANKEALDRYKRTPLHKTASNGHTGIAQLLISTGANKEAQDNYKQTPLHVAARCGHTEIAKLLISTGANKEAQNKFKQTPLHLAADKGHTEIAKLLISAGANKEAQNYQKLTPLHVATQWNYAEVAQLLISAGTNKEAQNEYKETPLHIAAEWDHTGVAQLLISAGANKEALLKNLCTPLHIAAEHGKAGVAKLLLDAKANIEAKDDNGNTPLILASLNNQKTIVQFFIEKGALWCVTNNKNKNALEIARAENHTEIVPLLHLDYLIIQASIYGHPSIVKKLIAAGSKIDSKNHYEASPLHLAAANGHTEVAQLLISAGANKEAQTSDNSWDWTYKKYTPLHMAAQNGHTEVAQLLISAGANKEAQTTRKQTPLHCAARYGHTKVAQLLISIAALKKNTSGGLSPLHCAVLIGNPKEAEILIAAGANTNIADMTPLHWASFLGKSLEIKMLIKNGADLFGQTSWFGDLRPVDLAQKANKIETRNLLYFEMVKKGNRAALDNLVGYKVDLNMQDDHGKTMLHYAVKNNQPLIVKRLLEYEATTTIRDYDGNNPMQYLYLHGSRSFKDYLHKQLRPKFCNIIGLEPIIEKLKNTLLFLKNPNKFSLNRSSVPEAILLYGPRGTGKTFTAQALAFEAECTFVELELFKRTPEDIKKSYALALQKAPSLFFIDEIDDVTEYDSKSALLLRDLVRKQRGRDNVVFVGTTNWIHKLDKGLFNSFRKVDRVAVPLPSFESRQRMLKLFINNYSDGIERGITLKKITIEYAKKTRAKSGRDLKELIEHACALAQIQMRKGIDDEFSSDEELSDDLFPNNESPTTILTLQDLLKAFEEQDPVKNMLIESIKLQLPEHFNKISDAFIESFVYQLEELSMQNIELLVKKVVYWMDYYQKDAINSPWDYPNYFKLALQEINNPASALSIPVWPFEAVL